MPKSKVKKKTAYTMSSVSRTPIKVKAGPSSIWYVSLLITLGALGLLWIVFYYLAADPNSWGAAGKPFHWMAELEAWNYLIGFGLIVTSLLLAMKWR